MKCSFFPRIPEPTRASARSAVPDRACTRKPFRWIARVFIGSFNFDPRSAKLNTELGFVIESPALAQQIEAAFNGRIPAEAYEVRLSDTGDLYWIERREGKPLRHDTELGTSFWQRAGVWFVSLLPIEWLL
jgi:putative cardiolipin synthase